MDGAIKRGVGRSNGMLKKEIQVTDLSRMLGRCGCRKRGCFAAEAFADQFDSRRGWVQVEELEGL